MPFFKNLQLKMIPLKIPELVIGTNLIKQKRYIKFLGDMHHMER